MIAVVHAPAALLTIAQRHLYASARNIVHPDLSSSSTVTIENHLTVAPTHTSNDGNNADGNLRLTLLTNIKSRAPTAAYPLQDRCIQYTVVDGGPILWTHANH